MNITSPYNNMHVCHSKMRPKLRALCTLQSVLKNVTSYFLSVLDWASESNWASEIEQRFSSSRSLFWEVLTMKSTEDSRKTKLLKSKSWNLGVKSLNFKTNSASNDSDDSTVTCHYWVRKCVHTDDIVVISFPDIVEKNAINFRWTCT